MNKFNSIVLTKKTLRYNKQTNNQNLIDKIYIFLMILFEKHVNIYLYICAQFNNISIFSCLILKHGRSPCPPNKLEFVT